MKITKRSCDLLMDIYRYNGVVFNKKEKLYNKHQFACFSDYTCKHMNDIFNEFEQMKLIKKEKIGRGVFVFITNEGLKFIEKWK